MTAAQAEESSLQSIITRAIGADADVRPDLYTEKLQAGDTLLLTSDGLTRHVQQQELSDVVSGAADQHLDEVCQRLIDVANERGGTDNVTCMLIRVAANE
jgi:protein phosphatase